MARSRDLHGSRLSPRRARSTTSLILALTALLVAVGCTAGTPTDTPSASASSTSALLTAAVEGYLDDVTSPAITQLRAVLVTVDGKPVVEHYRASAADEAAQVYSVTKSVTSTLIGIAEAEGLVSLDDRLPELLPQHTAVMSPDVATITLRHLLTMTSGLPADPPDAALHPSVQDDDWVASALDFGVVAPVGRRFAYSSAGSHILSAILVEATGSSVLDYARPRLFDPLGIDTTDAAQPLVGVDFEVDPDVDDAAFAWPKDPMGIEMGGFGLVLSPLDMAKLGQLYLDGGRWAGRQVVPAEWVGDATTAHVTYPGRGWFESYGYQWWVTTVGGHHTFAAVGYGGQLVEVIPDLGLVVVTVSEVGTQVMDHVALLRMTEQVIVPALTP